MLPVVICLLLGACRERAKAVPSNGRMDEAGQYLLRKGDQTYELAVRYSREKTVVVEVRYAGTTLIKEDTAASMYIRWYLFWDEPEGLLWLYSSDIGTKYYDLSKQVPP